jgi:predicted phosphoribosyltransferase
VCRTLEHCADALVAAHVPHLFDGIARSYETFKPTSDDEVARILAESRFGRRFGSATSITEPLAVAAA